MTGPALCPCGSGRPYDACCGPVHRQEAPAATAEALMRSRYSAFVLGDEAHLLRTWHPATSPGPLELDPGQRWEGLQVLATSGGGLLDAEGTVEFRATSDAGVLHERSRFSRVDGRWVYVDGDPVGP